ncbi:heme-binding-like protein, chloroplastic [Cocos nucifera]|uniref:Heme-binding-like protein, chloroplastic n=1 Tax=Cocos nucifera TaxID=13894 RepID=A0A8K0IWN6_COCNU|nr:heme-binding-like protein, chloroplastic [Cocos nucifera]
MAHLCDLCLNTRLLSIRPSSIFQTGSPRNPSATTASAAEKGNASPPRSRSALETRISLVLALAFQASSVSQRVLEDLARETAKYAFPRRFEARNLEEALMSVPDLETVKFRVLKRTGQYEIREVEPYFIAETTMPGKTRFDFNGSSQAFNALASYLFGKNTAGEQMEMTTPVFTRKVQSGGEKMDMTTPVSGDQGKWQMSFVMPSKYGSNLPLPKDPSVAIKEVPRKIVAVMAFSGFVTDEDVKRRESKLREALRSDTQFQVKEDALVEVAQFNPPFTLPFTRRNEITLEVEDKTK